MVDTRVLAVGTDSYTKGMVVSTIGSPLRDTIIVVKWDQKYECESSAIGRAVHTWWRMCFVGCAGNEIDIRREGVKRCRLCGGKGELMNSMALVVHWGGGRSEWCKREVNVLMGMGKWVDLSRVFECWGKGVVEKPLDSSVGLAAFARKTEVHELHTMSTRLTNKVGALGLSTTRFVEAMVQATARTMGVTFAPGETPRAPQTTQDGEVPVRGGLHLEPECGFYERATNRGVCELDFESMHPSVVIARRICPTGKGVLPKLMKSLLDDKRACEGSAVTSLVVRRAFLKSIMVCTTGWLGIKLANGGDSTRRKCYGRILQATRDIMTETIEACDQLSATVEFRGLHVVYGVTDSVFVMTPKGGAGKLRDALSQSVISPRFNGSVKLCVNRVYDTLLLIKRNQYCGYDTDGKFKQVGLLRSTQHTNERIVVNASYEALLAPNRVIMNSKLDILRKTLDAWPQWRPATQSVISTLRRACGIGPLPPSIDEVIELVGRPQSATGPKCRSLVCYSR